MRLGFAQSTAGDVPEIPYAGVTGNIATEDELWAHRLTLDDADDVWEGPAKYFRQEAQDTIDTSGRFRRQPARVLMIGLDRTGRLLTFILESPRDDSTAHIVTGWPSDRDEQSRYRQPGGRVRRR